MLTAIQVGNFKAFAESQRILIRPLTLIYGANSSGKSSILHSLIFSQHAAKTGECDVRRTEVGGEAVDLGGFRQFVHQRNRESKVHLEWELDRAGFPDSILQLLPDVQTATLGIDLGLTGTQKFTIDDQDFGEITGREFLLAEIEFAIENGNEDEARRLKKTLDSTDANLTLKDVSELRRKLCVTKFSMAFDQKSILSASVRRDGRLRLDILDGDHKSMQYLLENLILAHSTSEQVDPNELKLIMPRVDAAVPFISFESERLFPERLLVADEPLSRERRPELIPVKKESRLEDLREVVEKSLPPVIEKLVLELSRAVQSQLDRLTYLGPLRTYPPRHIGLSETNDSNYAAGGGAAWELVRTNSKIRKKVNEWLGDEKKLSTTYELKIRSLLTIESIRTKMVEMGLSAFNRRWDEYWLKDVNIDIQGEIEGIIENLPERLQKMESLFAEWNELVIRDKRTDTTVSHRDVGIGVSQVLPVLVMAFASEDKIFAMEQPEIHLHPALQAELGDVFIESALGGRNNTLLIETHSEHLLLRIMRRMRETAAGDLHEGIPPVTPKDVCVLYVQPKGSCSVVKELELDEEGQLLDAWPGGFFEEGYRERFA